MVNNMATPIEVCERWSLRRLLDAHEILDIREADQRRQADDLRRKMERVR